MTVHASKELQRAMLGECPYHGSGFRTRDRGQPDAWIHSERICGEHGGYALQAWISDTNEDLTKGGEINCPDCLRIIRASLPEEALVRLDYLEERGRK